MQPGKPKGFSGSFVFMPKEGFKNQWIEISRVGKHKDSTGVERDLTADFFEKIIGNTKPKNAPITIGHPEMNAPAFGWVTKLRMNGNVLEAQFAETNDDFEQMVERGEFKKRSASFYMYPPSLKHVGFLGATPPAVKGLRDIQFSDGDSVTVEISFNEEDKKMEKEDVNKVADSLWERIKNSLKGEAASSVVPPPATASFSEENKTDIQKMIDEAVAKAKTEAKAEAVAEFSETIKGLTDAVNANSASGKRAEIVSFVEGIPAEKGKHFLKRAGVVEFLEACATVDAANENKEVISFSEGEGDKKVEHKFTMLGWAKNLISALPPMIEFGEKFGNITATKEATEAPKNAANLSEMRDEMGIKSEGGAK